MAFEHSEITGWDLDSDTESIGELVLNMVEGGNNDNNEIDRDVDEMHLGNTISMQYQLDSDGENYRSLGPGSSPLCRFLSEHGTRLGLGLEP